MECKYMRSILSTKVRIGPEQVHDIPGAIERSAEASLKRLQGDKVDLMYLHSTVTRVRGTFRNSISIDDVLGKGGVVADEL